MPDAFLRGRRAITGTRELYVSDLYYRIVQSVSPAARRSGSRGKARRGGAGQGGARQGKAKRGRAGRSEARQHKATQGFASVDGLILGITEKEVSRVRRRESSGVAVGLRGRGSLWPACGLTLFACVAVIEVVRAQEEVRQVPEDHVGYGAISTATAPAGLPDSDERLATTTTTTTTTTNDETEGGEEAGSRAETADDPRGALIPRAAIVDMTRAQSRVICTSDVFLGCMGFDSTECLDLSERAIDQCLMSLPPSFDPTKLDNETLEACPKALYEEAGYPEEKAAMCFEEAIAADAAGSG